MGYLTLNHKITKRKILLFIKVFCLIIFSALALQISYLHDEFSWDKKILLTIHNTSNYFLDNFTSILTNFGGFKLILLFTISIGFLLFFYHKKRLLTYLITSILTSAVVNFIIKIFFHRPRPNLWESSYPLPSDFSFPSGHAMGSMTLALTLVVIFWGSRYQFLLWILAAIYIISIAWTRLYLGVHYPSDILGGWLLGIAWTTLITLLLNPRKFENNTN